MYPHLLLLLLGGANVCVWPQQNMLQLCLLLIDILDSRVRPDVAAGLQDIGIL